ncbi:MAG: hypothetical protein ABIC04_00610 [Nanoarchaeota archaeon]
MAKINFKKIPWAKLNLNKIPLELIPLNKIPLRKIGRLLNLVLPSKDIKNSEKILVYIRIYSRLISSYELLNKKSYKRAFEHLIILKNLTKDIPFRDEKNYIEHIQIIVKKILQNKKSIISRLKKYSASDPAHSKTNLLSAQNICILRILKVNM